AGLDGLASAGTATGSATLRPAEELRIGPVPIYSRGAASVRLINLGDEVATVNLEVLGPQGSTELAGAQELESDPNTVTDVSLDGIETGYSSIALHSDQPITGAVLLSRTGQAGELDPDQPVVDRDRKSVV